MSRRVANFISVSFFHFTVRTYFCKVLHMKAISQEQVMDMVRKPMPPPTRVQRPVRGGGYRRKSKWNKKEWSDE